MKTSEIIRVYKIQNTPCDGSPTWFWAVSIRLQREHLIQVLKDTKHCDHICNDVDGWLALNRWTDLVAMVDMALNLKTDSYLNTIS